MKLGKALTIAAVLVLWSAYSLASSIGDPGGIIRRGFVYDSEAIINENLQLTFGNEVVTSFNPFTADFCHGVSATESTPAGQECDFENQSGQIINNVTQIFASTFTGDNGLTCQNEIQGTCDTGPNSMGFDGLGIPSTTEGYYSLLSYDGSGDPDFNILYFGFTVDNADIKSTGFNVPEPASLALLGTGLLGLGLGFWRKKPSK